MLKNYWKIASPSLLFFRFMFIDTADYLADQLFIRHKVRVWFGKEFVKKDSPFRLILCKVKKKDVDRFLDALGELENKMLLRGYPEYTEFCHQAAGLLDG